MALQVKLPGIHGGALLSCPTCDFQTRLKPLFGRHTKRCQLKGSKSFMPFTHNWHYKCQKCDFDTYKSKDFLTHQKEVHDEDFEIFSCTMCDYATKYKCKIYRHEDMVHKVQNTSKKRGKGAMKKGAKPNYNVIKKRKLSKGKKQLAPAAETPEENGENMETDAVQQNGDSDMPENETVGSVPDQETISATGPKQKTDVLQCPHCIFKTKQNWMLKKHIRGFHTKLKLFKCEKCDFETNRRIEFCIHKSSHSNRKTFYCSHCPYRTTLKNNLDRHTRNHEESGPLKCDLCSYSSNNAGAINRHRLQVHNLAVQEKGAIPEKSVSFEIESGPPSVVTPVTEITANESATGDSSAWETTFEQTPNASDTKANKRRGRKPNDDHEIDVMWRCPICSLKYRRTGDLNRHMKKKHNMKLKEYMQLMPNETASQGDQQPLNLSMKTNETESTGNEQDEPLDLSLKGNTPPRPENLKCSHCSYIAKLPCDLRRHMLVHSVEKRFRCPYCMHKYKYQLDLNLHLRKIHRKNPSQVKAWNRKTTVPKGEERPSSPTDNSSPLNLKCIYCSYIGKYRSELRNHMRLHTGNKPFRCHYCNYETYWKGDMKRHLPKHHSKEIKEGTDMIKLLEETYQGKEKDLTLEQVSEQLAKHADTPPPAPPRPQIKHRSVATKLKFHRESWSAVRLSKRPIMHKKRRTVPGDRPFHCQFCEYESHWKGDMKRHFMKRHEEKLAGDVDVRVLLEQADRRGKGKILLPRVVKDETVAAESDEQPMEVTNERENLPKLNKSTPEHEPVHKKAKVTENSAKENGTGSQSSPKRVYCPKCPFSCDAPSKLKSHMEIHANLKKFKCPYCGKRSNWKWDVGKHIRKEHPEGDKDVVTLSDEEARATLQDYLIKHKSPQKRDSPQSNSNRASEHSQLVKLIMAPPVNASELKENYKRYRPYKCSKCERRSNWKWDLNRHIRQMHPGAKIIEMSEEEARRLEGTVKIISQESRKNLSAKEQTPDINSVKRYKCSVCPYRSNFSSDIVRHLKRKHGKTHVKVIKLGYEEALKTLKEYKYNWLKKKFVPSGVETNKLQAGSATAKMESAGKNKIWKCRECPFQDKNKAAVLEHLASHSSEGAYKCAMCGHTSDYKNSLYRHLREKHGTNDYSYCVESLGFADNQSTNSSASATDSYADCLIQVDGEPGLDLFRCKACNFTNRSLETLRGHVEEQHGEFLAARGAVTNMDLGISNGVPSSEDMPENATGKKYKCNVCPYRTNKKAILKIHKSYHKPQPGNKFACQFCPYYVCAKHLLYQHLRLHTGMAVEVKNTKFSTPTKSGHITVHTPETEAMTKSKKRYTCDKCPYDTNSKNDHLYHKQFHRPKAAATYKCEHCPYWVAHRRLLKQHSKLHQKYDQIQVKQVRNSMQLNLVASPAKSDVSELYSTCNPLDQADLKQSIIAAKITSINIGEDSLVQAGGGLPRTPIHTPSKAILQSLASDPSLLEGYIVNKSGHILSSGAYRKLHRCRYCPYTNVRSTNLRMHERMHGYRKGKDLFKCPYCDYYVGNKGLLSHHIKVHSVQYKPGQDEINDVEISDEEAAKMEDPDQEDTVSATKEIISYRSPMVSVETDSTLPMTGAGYYIKYDDLTGEHLLERLRFKKYCCEKCPYATAKATQFERHTQLHGSKQKYTCEFCDYSVPGYNLLLQHKKLHMMPNPNLLTVQSVGNLQHLPEVPADIAAATNFPITSSDDPMALHGGVHDHIGLYENTNGFTEPKKLYRCDRCPYANVRRDHLLAHLKFHMLRSDLHCPYCDYSVSKQHLLTQHIKIHFNPFLTAGDVEENDSPAPARKSNSGKKEPEFIDISELQEKDTQPDLTKDFVGTLSIMSVTTNKEADKEPVGTLSAVVQKEVKKDDDKKTDVAMDTEKCEETDAKVDDNGNRIGCENAEDKSNTEDKSTVWICQYCDRNFCGSDKLLRHEMQHLVGNRF